MKKALYISVSFNIILILFFAGKRYYYSHSYQNNILELTEICNQHNKEMIAYYDKHPLDSGDIVFVGNSLTEGFKVQDYFNDVKNRGIGGNVIDQLLGRISQVAKYKPRKILIEIGINDLRKKLSVDSLLYKYNLLIKKIKSQSPTTEIIIQSLFPVTGQYAQLQTTIRQTNERLKDLANKENVIYMNLYDSFLKNGRLDSAITTDGLHLNDSGYAIWAEALRSFVQ